MKAVGIVAVLLWSSHLELSARVVLLRERLAAEHREFVAQRAAALPGLTDFLEVAPLARAVVESSKESLASHRFAWRRNVTATVFWVGELPTQHNPTPNTRSAWDPNWERNFGGVDDPERRIGWLPEAFIPKLNPFYVALPYNDVAPGGLHRAEAAEVVPWFWEKYRGSGISVCKGRWVLIHHRGRVCYAQWEDVGPFETDHWQYVFGSEAPRANRNQAAGIDVSPAVRDVLELRSGERVEWRFVDDHQVPPGPWRDWGASDPASSSFDSSLKNPTQTIPPQP